MAASGAVSRSWCFTINNWTAEEYAALEGWPVEYLIVGKETGEEGTPHLQGAVIFKKPQRLAGVKKLNGRAHWETMKAKDDSAFDYCKKEGAFQEWGARKGQGKRSDIDKVYDALEKGEPVMEVAFRERLGYQAVRHMQLLSRAKKPADVEKQVNWYYGETGTGKSREARADDAHFLVRDGAFWSSYNGEKVVCLDDLRPEEVSRGHLLRMLDRYTFEISIKGETRWWAPEVIYITTPYTPEQFWDRMKSSCNDDKVGQLLRRITRVKEFKHEEAGAGGGGSGAAAPLPLVRSEEVILVEDLMDIEWL